MVNNQCLLSLHCMSLVGKKSLFVVIGIYYRWEKSLFVVIGIYYSREKIIVCCHWYSLQATLIRDE